MKKTVILFLLTITALLSAMVIPYSKSEVKTTENCIDQLYRTNPDDSLVCEYSTKTYLWHDDQTFFALFEADINPDLKKGTFSAGEGYPDADFMRLQIITNPSSFYGYVFYIFPLENNYDGVRGADLNIEGNWNSNYSYQSSFKNGVWTALLQVPFKDLRFENCDIKNWKIITTRYLSKKDEYYSFPFVKTDMGKDYFRNAFDIQLKHQIQENSNSKLRPYFIQKYDIQADEFSEITKNYGLDLSFNPNSSTKAKLSINPDYSDVPMDRVQDNSNERYLPYYSETRFFFTEDLDVFGVSDELFYTRNLRQPSYAFKLTGSRSHYTYGLLSARDKEVIDNGDLLNSADFFNILSFKPFTDNLSMQTTLMNNINENFHSDVLHLNPVWEINSKHSLWSEINSSLLKYDGVDSKYGYDLHIGYKFDWKDFSTNISAASRSKDFSSTMGRIFETDYTSTNAYFNYYREIKDNKYWKNLGFSGWGNSSITNEAKEFGSVNGGINFWFNTTFELNFWNNYNLGKYHYVDDYNLFTEDFDWDSYSCGLSFHKLDWLGISLNMNNSTGLIYSRLRQYKSQSVSLNTWGELGKYISYRADITSKRYLNFEEDYSQEILANDGSIIYIDDYRDGNYLYGNFSTLFIFSKYISLSSGIGFNNINNYYSNKTSHLGIYSNFTWEFKPDYHLYIGFNTAMQEFDNQGIFDDSRLVNYEQCYLKISYTL